MTRTLLATLLLAVPIAPARAESDASASVQRLEGEGDRAWADRAAGFLETGTPEAGPVGRALAAYDGALAQDPTNLELHFKLIEALYFQGHFVARDRGQEREATDRQLEMSQRALELVEPSGPSLERLGPAERAARLQNVPGAAEAHFWAAISWGVWGMSHGNFASARRNVAGKIRDHAQILILLDDRFADAGGLRLLGRLHTATPKVPFFTSWIDRAEGLKLLRRAHEISDRDSRNPLFLAEAILDYEPASRHEATALLREVSRREPDPAWLVEESETLEEARRLLAELEAGGEAAAADGEEAR